MENVKNMENSVGACIPRDRDETVGSRVPRDRGETVGGARRAPRDDWRKVRLGEICIRVCSGGTPMSNNPFFYEGGTIPWLNTKEVNFEDVYSTEKCITQAGYDNSAAKWVEPNSVIIAMYGATAGKSCVTKIRLTTNQACCNLQIDGDKADYRFVYYAIRSQYEKLASLAVGGAQQNLNAQFLKNYLISLPPLPIQQRIAEILGAYDDAIENNRRRIALLEKMARELYRERFVRRAGNVCRRVVISDVCLRIGSGGTPSRKVTSYWECGNIDWFKTKELFDDWLIDSEEKITREGLDNSSAKIFAPNTIVMAIYASPTVGRLGVLSKDACTNQAALGLVADEATVSWQWLFFLLQNKRDYFNRIAAGAGQQNISAEVVKNCEFDLPEKSEIDAFTAAVAPLFEERLSLALQNRNLARQRDRLLPRLMSGRLEVGA